MAKKKVLIITSGRYPFGSPMALRIRAFACLFESCGWNTVVYSDQITLGSGKAAEDKYQNTKIYSLGKKLTRIKKLMLPLMFSKRLREIISMEEPSLIFSNCIYNRFTKVRSIANRYKLPLVIQSCEWYDPSTFKYGRLSHHYIMHSYCWKYQYVHSNGVVAISRLLQKHYQEYINDVIRIPTIVDAIDSKYRITVNADAMKVKLLFAGSLARTKDSIKQYFEALEFMKEDSHRIQFEICGVTENEIHEHLGDVLFHKYANQINLHGRIPQDKISDMYMACDYGIFFRPDQRSSHAGFSTKLGEGMSTGTPFIVNDTSDIAMYIKSGENGFLVNNISEIANTLDAVIRMSTSQMENMRKHARKTAETFFYYKTYEKEFAAFLNHVTEEYAHGKI